MATLSGDFHTVSLGTQPWEHRGNRPSYFKDSPREIGHFSFDAERKYHDDNSQLRFFHPPDNYERCHFDLRQGYKSMIWRSGGGAFTYVPSNLLTWTMHHSEQFLPPLGGGEEEGAPRHLKSINADFVCKRGLLTKILTLPYETNDDLRFAVIRMKGTYYLCQFETEAGKRGEVTKMKEPQREMVAWGWKFEQYVTADNADDTPDTERPVDNNMEYGVVVRSKIGPHSLVYGGEVDCIDPNDNDTYVELKTSKILEVSKQRDNFCRFKLLKCWAQSLLLGINKIVYGFRDEDGIIRQLKKYSVKDIPAYANSQVSRPDKKWDPSVCFNFMDSCLAFIKSTIPNDDQQCAHVFYFKPKCPLVYEGTDPSLRFLPESFLNWDLWEKQ